MNKAEPSLGQPASTNADCASCGRYIGPVFTCPYCGAEARGRLPLHVLRWAALTLAVLGLAVFYVLAWRSELPVTPVFTLKPSMQFAKIRVRGHVATKPRITQRDGAPDFLVFDVDDGTGRISVAASRSTAHALVDRNLVPGRGQLVEATGSLNAKPGRRLRIYLDAPSGLRLESNAPAGVETGPNSAAPVEEAPDEQT